jgi:hypothetical protein
LTSLPLLLKGIQHSDDVPRITALTASTAPTTAAARPTAGCRPSTRYRKGETMTTTAMAIYAYDQIDQVRTELNAVSK